MPKLSNPYLTQASYQLLTTLLSSSNEEEEEDEISLEYSKRRREQDLSVLNTLLSIQPTKTDHQLAPYWLAVVARAAVSCYSGPSSLSNETEVLAIWKVLWSFLDSTCTSEAHKAAAEALSLIVEEGCIPVEQLRGLSGKNQSRLFGPIVESALKALSSLVFADSLREILSVLTTVAKVSSPLHSPVGNTEDQFQFHNKVSISHPLIPLLVPLVTLRNKKDFEYKEETNQFFGAMMQAVGVDGVLKHLPLGLLPKERSASSSQPNAYLLPLIPPNHPTPLSHFVQYFIPLSESLWELAEKSEKDAEKKVYRVLIDQIWATFPSYCWDCYDLQKSLTPQFAERLTQVLYHEPTLRAPILRGLKAVVEGNQAALHSQIKEDSESDGTDDEAESTQEEPSKKGPLKQDAVLTTPTQATENIQFLNKQAKSWLAVLFNVFTSVEKENRMMVGGVISAWASIANEPELAGAYRTVTAHINTNLDLTMQNNRASGTSDKSIKTLTQMLDILLLLVPYLPLPQLREVINIFLEKHTLIHPDGGVQKLGYRVLGRVVVRAIEKGEEQDELVEKVLKEVGDTTDIAAGAVKERLNFLALVTPSIPSESLHLLVSFLMEAIMGVKEHSEKARKAAFELLVVMGEKMKEGGSIRMDLVEGSMDEDGMARDASAEEFIKMVAASLAAEKDHTISAGVMSLSRVLFEFRDDLSEEIQVDVITTVYPLVAAKNREIVKSVLGFVKLTIHSLSPEIVQPHLETLVPALMVCLSIHKHHFKVKIRHVFERLMRKFGADEIIQYAQAADGADEGGLKMLSNIYKRKEKAAKKRREAAERGEEESEAGPSKRTTTGDAFEDVLYGSESEVEDSDAEEAPPKKGAPKGAPKKGGKEDWNNATRLRIDDDEPMDLLEGTAGKLINANRGKQKRPGQEASKFKTEEETGKIIIDEESDSDTPEKAKRTARSIKQDPEDLLAGAAYKENLVSVDGFTRNPNGTIKFHKDTKKRRREEMEMADGDIEMEDASAAAGGKGNLKKGKRHKEIRLGQEFKAKKAGGDVKKNGMDPYAYLTLGQAAGGRKGRGKAKVSILGKR
ncbi:NUC173-domain-containing protein [Serendipita vermifera]|nr:NUC173-domain-containing protein [Serendipita vermifera]